MALKNILILLCLGYTSAHENQEDVGYLDLFEDAMEEAEDQSLTVVGKIPDWLDGTFYQTGPARWSLAGMNFTHVLDGFSKVHKFAFHDGQVTFGSKFLHSLMLNRSLEKNEIVWGVLAQETSPPRTNPGLTGMSNAPCDNNNVNTWMFQPGRISMLSDTITIVDINSKTLDFDRETLMTGFKNASNPMMDPVTNGASAHPHCADDGSFIGLREASRLAPIGNSRMSIYKLHPDSPTVVQDIVHVDVPRASYAHSFGLTQGMQGGEHAVVVAQPIYPDMMKIAETGSLAKGFVSPEGAKTQIHVLPMDASSGKKVVSIDQDPFYFGHFLNTFSAEAGKITFDIDVEQQVFFDRFSFAVQRNKSSRDNWAAEHGDAYSTPTRYEVDIEAGTVTSKQLFPDPKTQCAPNSKWCEFDLFKLHPDDVGKPYCGFWSQQVYFNSSSFASQGIVRAELCGQDGPTVVASWHRPNTYPGEPQFVPKPGATDKTEGVIIFKVYEGVTKKSKIIVTDAKTLVTIASAELPVRVPFTVHGNFYSADSLGQGHCVSSNKQKSKEMQILV